MRQFDMPQDYTFFLPDEVREITVTCDSLDEAISYLPRHLNYELCRVNGDSRFWRERSGQNPVRKVAHIFPKVPLRVCIIRICSIQILLSIQRSLTLSCVQQHHMRTPLKKHLTSVGVYASIYPKSTDTLKYGMVNASWVNTIMDSKPTVLFLCVSEAAGFITTVCKDALRSFPISFILKESNKFFLYVIFQARSTPWVRHHRQRY